VLLGPGRLANRFPPRSACVRPIRLAAEKVLQVGGAARKRAAPGGGKSQRCSAYAGLAGVENQARVDLTPCQSANRHIAFGLLCAEPADPLARPFLTRFRWIFGRFSLPRWATNWGRQGQTDIRLRSWQQGSLLVGSPATI